MADDPRTRWTAFLQKIEARHQEMLDGAREALPGLVPDADFDLQPFLIALTAVRTQCIGLAQKIDQTFSQSAEAALEAAGFDAMAEQERGAELGTRLELALKEAEIAISGAAAEAVVTRANEVLAADFKCTRCGAPLKPKEAFFRAHYVPCDFCRTMNTFEPGLDVRMVEHFAVHALAERVSWPLHRAFLEAEQLFRSRRGSARDKVALLAHYERFVDAYLAERARLLPELEKDLAADRASRVEAFVYSLA